MPEEKYPVLCDCGEIAVIMCSLCEEKGMCNKHAYYVNENNMSFTPGNLCADCADETMSANWLAGHGGTPAEYYQDKGVK
jgi:hypothetical protein